jgi:hypothetical protein
MDRLRTSSDSVMSEKKPASGGEIRYGKYPDVILTSQKYLSSSKG